MKKNIVILFTAVALCTAVPIMTYAQEITTMGVRKRGEAQTDLDKVKAEGIRKRDEAKKALAKIIQEKEDIQNANLQVEFVNNTKHIAELAIDAAKEYGADNTTIHSGPVDPTKSTDIKSGADDLFFGRAGSKFKIKVGTFTSPELTINWGPDKKFKTTFTDDISSPNVNYEVNGEWDEDYINIFVK